MKRTNWLHFRSSNFLLIGFVGGLGLRKWYGALNTTFNKSANKSINAVQKVAGMNWSESINYTNYFPFSWSNNLCTDFHYGLDIVYWEIARKFSVSDCWKDQTWIPRHPQDKLQNMACRSAHQFCICSIELSGLYFPLNLFL